MSGGQEDQNVERKRKWAKTLEGSSIAGAALVLICTAVASASLVIYFIQFAGAPISPKGGISLWVAYASAIGPMLQTVVSAATLVVAAWLGYKLNSELEENRKADQAAAATLQEADAKAGEERRAKDETNRELTRLSEFMVNGDFYLNVTQPSWQIAADWFNLTGQAGDEFRTKLVCEFIELPMPAYANWLESTLPAGPNSTQPDNKKYSNYMVLALWTRFWSQIVFLQDEGIINPDGVRKLFLEWYRWWAPFMIEYTHVVAQLIEHRGQPLTKHASIERIIRLNHTIFGLCTDPPAPEIQARINETVETAKRIIATKVGGKLTQPDFPWSYLTTRE